MIVLPPAGEPGGGEGQGETSMDGVVACVAYGDGKRLGDVPFDSCGEARRDNGQFVWIGLYEPSEELLQVVKQQFGFHELAVEDAHQAHQRPKLEVYGDSLFVVLRTAQLVKGEVAYGETHVFVGKGYIVSVRHGASTPYTNARGRLEHTPAMLRMGEQAVLHAILDFVADNFFPVIDEVARELEEIECHVLDETLNRTQIERIYYLRRQLLGLRGAVSPLLEVCNKLERLQHPILTPEVLPYIRDVHDHVLHVAEAIDNLRQGLAAAFETEILLSGARQNDIVRQLAAWAAILAVPTAIAGIYGMNFENMPELKMEYGYFGIWAVIVGFCGFLYWRFKRSGWL
jgi:magnesium transporter